MLDKKLAFYEIGKGALAADAQSLFEELQEHSLATETQTKMTIEITIDPPPDEEQRYGRIQYKLSHKKQPVTSKGFTTLFKAGKIINDGDSEMDVLQLDLDIDTEVQENKIRNIAGMK